MNLPCMTFINEENVALVKYSVNAILMLLHLLEVCNWGLRDKKKEDT